MTSNLKSKTTKKTVATKAEAIQKTDATREARHTMGPKQKAQIKGTVTPQPSQGGSVGPAPAVTPVPKA